MNQANQDLADPKLVGDGLLGNPSASQQCSYFTDLFPCKFSATAIVFRIGAVVPSFCNLVVAVFLICAEPQVRRIHARRVVARVADLNPRRYFGFGKTKRNAMRLMDFSTKSEKSIPLVMTASCPLPASLRMWSFGDFGPKVFCLSWGKRELYLIKQTCIRIFSGGHNFSMPIVRAFESLVTAPTLEPIWRLMVGDKAQNNAA